MTIVMDGKKVAGKLTNEMKLELDALLENDIKPKLAIVRIGELPDSIAYENGAMRRLNGIGVDTVTYSYPEDITQHEFINHFCDVNANKEIHGILLLRPLPTQINVNKITQLINPIKDVDGMSPLNLGKVISRDENCFPPCTPAAVMHLLKYYNIDLLGKNVVIVGHSAVVGKPLNNLMLNEEATVTVCHINSIDVASICQKADIIVSATGKAGLIQKDFLKQGATVIDVGITLDENGEIHGGVDYKNAIERADYITPVPGGVGSLTTTILAKHVIQATKQLTGDQEPLQLNL